MRAEDVRHIICVLYFNDFNLHVWTTTLFPSLSLHLIESQQVFNAQWGFAPKYPANHVIVRTSSAPSHLRFSTKQASSSSFSQQSNCCSVAVLCLNWSLSLNYAVSSLLLLIDTVSYKRWLASLSSFIQAWDWHCQSANNSGVLCTVSVNTLALSSSK